MQVEEFIQQSAERFPDKVCLVCNGKRLTYRELNVSCNRLAHGLRDLGLERGDRVAVYLDNTVEAVLGIFGVLKAGGVFVVVNPTTKTDKLAFILNNCRARALITHAMKLQRIQGCLELVPDVQSVILAGTTARGLTHPVKKFAALDALLESHAGTACGPDTGTIDIDLASLIYTSGSTGNPKGVMLTHLNMVAAATSITTYLENTPDDIILNVLPLSFDYGLYQVLMAFKTGGTVVLERSFTYPKLVLDRLVEEKVTGFPILPTILAILFQMDLEKYDFSGLRYLTNTGAALPVPYIRRLRDLFPGVRIYSMYGLTECKRVAYLPPDQIDARPSSVGRAMPNVEVYIVDEDGQRVAPGVPGELVVRGSNVMKGYWELPEETERMLRPGPLPGEMALHTGDLFRMDPEGYLYFIGRKDDIIKSRGEKVSPKEVENVLYQLEGVAEAAVIGVSDEVLGQAIKAFVRPRNGTKLTSRQVLKHCSEHLESFMVPQHVEFRDEFPRTTSGKINKRELR